MKPRLAGVESAGFIRPVQWLARGARGGSGTETMGTSALRMGIAGCGAAARIHLDRLLAQGEVAILARPWLTTLGESESTWRFDPKVAGGGTLADAGDHVVDALLWTTGQVAREVAAFQSQWDPGIDLVTAAAIRLADGTPVTMAISGISPGALFALEYLGELGRLRATDQILEEERFGSPRHEVPLPPPTQTIDGDLVSAPREERPLCCPADQALEP